MSARPARRGVTALLLLFAAAAAVAQDTPPVELPAAVRAALANAGVPAEALGVAALPLDSAAPPWLLRPRRPMQPGSSMKVVTSTVALERLGPNLRGFTELRSAAPLVNGTLQGDLVLKGGADPELGVAQLWALLLELREAGVQTIAGDLLLDRTLFRPARFDQGLPPFDEWPEFEYNVTPDALHLASNLLPLELKASAEGVQVRSVPALPGLELQSRMTLNDKRCQDWDDDWQAAAVTHAEGRTRIELRGAFPRGCTQRTGLQLIDRNELAERLVRALWQGLGGTWNGRAREAAAPAETRVLARRNARPWGEVLRGVNKSSDNALSRLLFLQLGVAGMAAEPTATTAELAARAVREWFVQQGIATEGLVLDNGSGLSRSERISPLQMAQVLRAAARGPNAADLAMSLPTAGVDGTLRNRLKDSPATGWARLKTGTLRNVVALAGYVQDAAGWRWAVAFFVNHDNAGKARPVLDALVDQVARFGIPRPQGPGVGPQGEGP